MFDQQRQRDFTIESEIIPFNMTADFGQVIKLAKALIVVDPTNAKNPVFWREF